MRIRRNKISEAISVVLLSASAMGSSVAFAEEQKADNDIEVIEIKGIKGSLNRALSVKQDSTGFVDAISAEDVGKLPDNNVAEALQRVTGVSIQRSRGEGDFVSIRGLGPDFVRGTVNGRSLLNATETVDPIFNGNAVTSTGRAANFDILPSEIINRLEVHKSSSAKHVEGGIGGTVNLHTAKPLSTGNKIVGSLTANYREFNEETDPAFAGLYSWVNEDNSFGFLGSISYSDRSIREDYSRSFGWWPVFWLGSQLDTNNDGIGDTAPGDARFPLSNNAEAYEESRERTTVTGTLQWAGNDSNLTIDLLYSSREVSESHQNFIFLPFGSQDGFIAAGATVNADGSLQVGNFGQGGIITNNIDSTLRPELTTDLQDYEDDLFSIGVNYEKSIGDWELVTDISYSKAEGDNTFDRVRIDGDNGNFAFNTSVGQNGFSISQTNLGANASADLSNPANWVVSVFDDRFATNEDEEMAFQFDANRSIDSEFISSIDLGVRIRTREKTIERASNGNGIGVAGQGVTVADVGSFNRGASNFLDGMWNANFGFNSLIFPNNAAARAAFPGTVPALSADPFGSFSVEEDTYASYAQVNIDGDIGGVEVAGDIGVRIVLTDQVVSGSDAEFVITDNGGQDTTVFDSLNSGAATPVSFDETYTNVLPSLNLRFTLADDLYLRTAANVSMTRPTFNSLAPAFNINANSSTNLNNDNYAVSLSAGNPALKPFESTNYDLGVEWYFAESSALYVGLFHKKIEDFVATVTRNNVSELAGVPIRAVGVEQDGSRGRIEIDQVSQPDNQGEADVTGLEFGYQHAFDNGFGYIANLTLTENSAEFEATGENIDFPGVSKTSYNLTGYYENGPFEARVSYSSRSSYLVEPSAIGGGGQLFNDGYAQLDASVSYDVSENLTVFANAVNLNDEDQDVFQILPAGQRVYYSTSHVGPRFSFGVRGNF